MRSFCTHVHSCGLVLSVALATLALLPASVFADTSQHTSLASFQAATRANVLFEPFNGPSGPVNGLQVSGTGYVYSVTQSIGSIAVRNAFGIGAQADNASTLFTFTGRPVSAFAGTLRRIDSNGVSIGGDLTLTTNTGESFAITTSVGGTFFGFTTSQPFSVVTLNTAVAGQGYEFIDDVSVGIATSATELTDQCADAMTINPITAVQYSFTTVNTDATATPIPGSCAANPNLDNGPDVWVRFVSPVYGNATVTTCGATFDTVLRVFANCGPAGNGVGAVQIACNDDFCTGGPAPGNALASLVQFRIEAGEDYLVRVSGYSGATGSGNLTFSVVPDCRADFNHSGGFQEVSDIFDFLNAWFGGC